MGPPKLQDAKTVQEFDAIVKGAAKTVVFFWASWSETCKHMEAVLLTLAATHPAAAYVRVEAEEVDDVTERYGVTAVPHFVLLQGSKVAAAVEGADAPALTAAVERVVGNPAAAAAAGAGAAAAGTKAAAGTAAAAAVGGEQEAPGDVVARIERLLRSAPAVLFMKGTADAPRCGFSRKVVEALEAAGAPAGSYPTVDVLQDEPLRQALKTYSQWPTFPQLYVAGELVGGCDIVLEMQRAGELKQLLKERAPTLALHAAAAAAGAGNGAAANGSSKPAPAAAAGAAGAAGPAAAAAAEEQQPPMSDEDLRALTRRAPVMLFMKGTADAPRCGFSRKVVEALDAAGVPFATFDILGDERVRQGLKALSNWPTYPQLYAAGELVGGCDIVLEMQRAGELRTAVDELLHRTTEA